MEVDSLSVASSKNRVGLKKKSIPAGSSSSSPTEVPSKRPAKVSGTVAGEKGSFARPSHILFSVSASGPLPMDSSESASRESPANVLENRRRLFLDPCFEVDYIDRRKRAHESEEWSLASSASAASSSRTSDGVSPWIGVSKIERELVGCCEILGDNFYSHDNDEGEGNRDDKNENGGIVSDPSWSLLSSPTNSTGGVLAVDKEISFATILSRSCHTIASRSLALAILERTLQQQQQNDNELEDSFNERNIGDDYDKHTIGNSKNGRLCQKQRKRRFESFFAAGGLRILNQWLMDASSYETKSIANSTICKNAPASLDSSRRTRSNDNDAVASRNSIQNAHSTRPIAFSILLLLEHIPFEKKTVTNSKINKQIQKLGKKIVSIKEANKNGKALKEDLENWSTRKAITGDEGLTQILKAVDAVKASWREKAKTKGEKNHLKPFGAIQSKIKERMQDLTKFENGTVETRPEWYRPVEMAVAFKKKKKSEKRKAICELEIDKLNLKKKIKQVQSRGKELRERLRQRKVDHSHDQSEGVRDSIHVFSNKKVAWKDGMNGQIVRNRSVLEEVYFFRKDLPPSVDR
mmetsp:Transcript_7190/g.17529  ORF Transcript_7190/g.17529 Transcript_7190/m.17529 type:complete len:580 (+) Transcript_7190:88-1827(+)|eukprot:CAMPEP_0197187174 /NCGR_PEP_ID=MMETSP1423-20130617/15364_1 /TAXON_ID=476441 /ORGANISM="Pseudo-nitzschia heimii, Strain UNC1101" /LENGTH=579 /DNA_ID=CAMNT_0042638677 /DNA_START=12 /DNA_END=1751 /DNA_ORIENTATION=+